MIPTRGHSGPPVDEPADNPASDADAEIEREVRQRRKFSTTEALGRLAGPGAMKGASPVSRQRQAQIEIGAWLGSHIADTCGALRMVLHRNLKGSAMLLDDPDRPLVALEAYLKRLLTSDELLAELVREADVEWGRIMDERPLFERTGFPQDPDDPYTVQSVRLALTDALEKLAP